MSDDLEDLFSSTQERGEIEFRVRTNPEQKWDEIAPLKKWSFNFYSLLAAVRKKTYLLNRARTNEHLEVKISTPGKRLKDMEIRLYTRGLYSDKVWTKMMRWEKINKESLISANEEAKKYNSDGIQVKIKISIPEDLARVRALNP